MHNGENSQKYLINNKEKDDVLKFLLKYFIYMLQKQLIFGFITSFTIIYVDG